MSISYSVPPLNNSNVLNSQKVKSTSQPNKRVFTPWSTITLDDTCSDRSVTLDSNTDTWEWSELDSTNNDNFPKSKFLYVELSKEAKKQRQNAKKRVEKKLTEMRC